jgi:hypothetical protein
MFARPEHLRGAVCIEREADTEGGRGVALNHFCLGYVPIRDDGLRMKVNHSTRTGHDRLTQACRWMLFREMHFETDSRHHNYHPPSRR